MNSSLSAMSLTRKVTIWIIPFIGTVQNKQTAETESRLVVARAGGSDCIVGTRRRLPVTAMYCSRTVVSANVLNTTDSHTVKWLKWSIKKKDLMPLSMDTG